MATDLGQQDRWLNGLPCLVQTSDASLNTGSQDRWLNGLPCTVQFQQSSTAAPVNIPACYVQRRRHHQGVS